MGDDLGEPDIEEFAERRRSCEGVRGEAERRRLLSHDSFGLRHGVAGAANAAHAAGGVACTGVGGKSPPTFEVATLPSSPTCSLGTDTTPYQPVGLAVTGDPYFGNDRAPVATSTSAEEPVVTGALGDSCR